MSEFTLIGVALAKRVFQLHGARGDGSVAFPKKLSRGQLFAFVAQQPKCMIAMETCATAHGWGREFEGLGQDVRLIAPVKVKPFVKRQKNDVADAEAELRPTMRFVAVKTEDQQARPMLFRTRQMFVGQRTQMISALCGLHAEHTVHQRPKASPRWTRAPSCTDIQTGPIDGGRPHGSCPHQIFLGNSVLIPTNK